jgi:hypothetical protein
LAFTIGLFPFERCPSQAPRNDHGGPHQGKFEVLFSFFGWRELGNGGIAGFGTARPPAWPLVQGHLQHLREVQGAAIRRLSDLFLATETVRDDQCL